ncbi:MAG: M48 family metallopeptidase [Alphaproteobacteria bacterium]|nr:M48 family metallopeptidase [Alphaproteobacteria bacterium]
MTHGRWFDGKVATEHLVEVIDDGTALHLREGKTPVATWANDHIRVVDRLPTMVVLTTVERPDERLYLDDPTSRFAMVAAPIDPARRLLLRRMGLLIALAATIIAALIIVPRTTNVVPWLMPESAEKRLGEQVVAFFTSSTSRCESGEGRQAIEALAGRLAEAAQLGGRIRVTVVRGRMVNAFAAPGGEIVLFDGLLQATPDPEALAAVLAHEIAHEYHSHGIKRLTSSVGITALAGAVFGGGSGLFREGAELAALFAFSRDDEREADRSAIVFLQRSAIDPRGLTRVLGVFEKAEQQSGLQLPAYLSTHPATAERRAAAETANASGPFRPALGAEQWAALRRICA